VGAAGGPSALHPSQHGGMLARSPSRLPSSECCGRQSPGTVDSMLAAHRAATSARGVSDWFRVIPQLDGALRHPERVAIQRAGHAPVRYRDLLQRSNDVALGLKAALGGSSKEFHAGCLGAPGMDSVRVGPRVGILANAADYVAAQWGSWLAGCVAVPLCPAHSPAEMAHVIDASGCAVVLVPGGEHSAGLRTLAERASPSTPLLELDQFPTASDATVVPEPWMLEAASPRHVGSLMLFTSGTTSKPKGVLHTHGSVRAMVDTLVGAWGWSSEDTILHTLPMHHLHGVINVTACAQAAGATIDWHVDGFHPKQTWQSLVGGGANVFMSVPTVYARLLHSHPPPASDLHRQFRLMVSGSAPLPSTIADRWRELTGVSLLERYGMTEVGMVLSNGYEVENRRFGTVGRPLPGVQCAVKPSSEEGGVIEGELLVRGPMLFAGYWGRPSANAESITDHDGSLHVFPAVATSDGLDHTITGADKWFCTGDIVRVDEEGYWTILGRASTDIIKSGGYKLSALEIETGLLEHPAIAEAVVVGLPDESDLGEVVAVLVLPKPGHSLTPEDVREFCRGRLAPYKSPRRVFIRDSIPRNAMGKVNKKELIQTLV
jgi:malonyl-CoA/methylmalonyl-CoA synthetase